MELLPTKRTVTRVAGPPVNRGVAKGIDFVFVLMFFVGLGWLLDRAFGTKPLFTLVVFALGIVGQFARIWYAYDAEMNDEEARMASRRSAPLTTAPPTTPATTTTTAGAE